MGRCDPARTAPRACRARALPPAGPFAGLLTRSTQTQHHNNTKNRQSNRPTQITNTIRPRGRVPADSLVLPRALRLPALRAQPAQGLRQGRRRAARRGRGAGARACCFACFRAASLCLRVCAQVEAGGRGDGAGGGDTGQEEPPSTHASQQHTASQQSTKTRIRRVEIKTLFSLCIARNPLRHHRCSTRPTNTCRTPSSRPSASCSSRSCSTA